MSHLLHAGFVVLMQCFASLFAIGMVGCFFVLVLTFFEDLKTLFHP